MKKNLCTWGFCKICKRKMSKNKHCWCFDCYCNYISSLRVFNQKSLFYYGCNNKRR